MTKKQLSKKIERYEELIKLGQLTSSSLDYKNIQKKSEGKIKTLLNCERVMIFRYDNKKNILFREFQLDNKTEVVKVEVNEYTLMGSSALYSAILSFDELQKDLRYKKSPKYLRDISPSSVLYVPLLSKGELLGVIEAINSNAGKFDEEDIHFAQAIANQMTMSVENYLLFEKLQAQFIQVVEALADTIGKKDAYTGGHTKRVRHFAEMIACELDLPFEDMNNVKLAAVLHDIGKIGIEDSILKKRSPLTADEFEIMKKHPMLGYEILGHIESLSAVVDGMRFHHERPDGRGYPFGLKGDEIPLIAMIISVADTFDAMISTRPYRKGLPPMLAWQEIVDNRGTQFSERVVDAFDSAFRKTKMFKPSQLDKYKKAS
ncbi:HDIG domain protein [Bacteriovorax sp. Seq25_V]|nr:HDIG domain protein [Bacteriovorax sp. Seq25_V]